MTVTKVMKFGLNAAQIKGHRTLVDIGGVTMGEFLQVLGIFGIDVPVVGKIQSRFFHPFPHEAMSNDGDFFWEEIAAQGMICVMVGIDDLADGFLCHPANCTQERLGHVFDIQVCQ